jgi:hypothetical protein
MWTAPKVKPIALPPPPCPSYVIPGSQNLDPPYSWQSSGPSFFTSNFPWPRMPWPWESETRAPGTGLIATPCPPFPGTCPPPASPPAVTMSRPRQLQYRRR